MTKITMNDSLADAIVKMSEGNPGALATMMELIKDGKLIDPQDAFQPFSNLLGLDTWEIYGTAIYVLWNDKCDRDVRQLIILLRATQWGEFSVSQLKSMAADQCREIDITSEEAAALDATVCERLSGFMKPTEWRDLLAKRLKALEALEAKELDQ